MAEGKTRGREASRKGADGRRELGIDRTSPRGRDRGIGRNGLRHVFVWLFGEEGVPREWPHLSLSNTYASSKKMPYSRKNPIRVQSASPRATSASFRQPSVSPPPKGASPFRLTMFAPSTFPLSVAPAPSLPPLLAQLHLPSSLLFTPLHHQLSVQAYHHHQPSFLSAITPPILSPPNDAPYTPLLLPLALETTTENLPSLPLVSPRTTRSGRRSLRLGRATRASRGSGRMIGRGGRSFRRLRTSWTSWSRMAS
jgi:hypothetical protein